MPGPIIPEFSELPLVRLISAGLILLLMAACATEPPKEYIAPQGPEAEQCLKFCQSERFQCRTPLQERARECKAQFEYEYRLYEICVAQSVRKVCPRPFPCPAVNYQQCSNAFEKCFLGCGGRIRYPEDQDGP